MDSNEYLLLHLPRYLHLHPYLHQHLHSHQHLPQHFTNLPLHPTHVTPNTYIFTQTIRGITDAQFRADLSAERTLQETLSDILPG